MTVLLVQPKSSMSRCCRENTSWNKKHLKNVGPIRHCEPPHALILHCHSPGVTTTTTMTTTTRDRADRYGPIEWAQSEAYEWRTHEKETWRPNSAVLEVAEGRNKEIVRTASDMYTLCLKKKNDNDVVRYNFNAYQPISVIFGRDVAERICYRMVICHPTSPN